MKWITHEAVAVGGAYLLGMPPIGLAGVFAGSVLPDALDQGMARLLVFRQLAFNRLHRGPTHWFGWWLALFGAVVLQTKSLASGDPATLFVMGIGFGALMHVLLDMCTETGVPVAPWSKKHMMSLKLCKTGSVAEYGFLAASVLFFALMARKDLMRLLEEAKRLSPL